MTTAEDEMLRLIDDLDRRDGHGGLVPLYDLREATAGLISRAELDALLIAMERAYRLDLKTANDPRQLPERGRQRHQAWRTNSLLGGGPMSLKRAIDTYEDWHAKPARRIIPLRCTFAPGYSYAGLANEIIYKSSKWRSDGRTENYHHTWNEPGTRTTKCWKPGGRGLSVRGKAVTFLGHLLAYNYTRPDGREVLHEYGSRNAPILAAIGKGKICLIPASGSGVIPIVWTGLRVTSRGLVNVPA